jgi:hypothetical protein
MLGRGRSYARLGGSCSSSGPSLSPSSSTPSRNSASGCIASRSRRSWLITRGSFTAKRKPAGTLAAHRA